MKTPAPKESDIQRTYISWVRVKELTDWRYRLIIKVPNEVRGNFGWLQKMKAEGLKKGVPDVLCLCPVEPFSGLAIEFKRKGSKPSKEQAECLDLLVKAKWATFVLTDAEHAMKLTEQYMQGLQE